MGAGVLRKKIQDAGLSQISVTNSAINNLPPDVDLVITHRDLTERVDAEQSFIRAVYGVGYRWEADACRIV